MVLGEVRILSWVQNNNKIMTMANTTLKVRNRIATKTSSEWETENPILLKGEMGYDSTSKRYKIGDGVNRWKNLEYTTINGKSKLTLFKSSTKTNLFLSIPAYSNLVLTS